MVKKIILFKDAKYEMIYRGYNYLKFFFMIKLTNTYHISLKWFLSEICTQTSRNLSAETVLKIDFSSRPTDRRTSRYFEPPHSTLLVFSLDSTKDAPSKHFPVMWRPNRVILWKTDPKWSVMLLLCVFYVFIYHFYRTSYFA